MQLETSTASVSLRSLRHSWTALLWTSNCCRARRRTDSASWISLLACFYLLKSFSFRLLLQVLEALQLLRERLRILRWPPAETAMMDSGDSKRARSSPGKHFWEPCDCILCFSISSYRLPYLTMHGSREGPVVEDFGAMTPPVKP